MNFPVIDPNAIFTIKSLTEALGLKPGTLPRELRLRRLRYCKRAGRCYILGSWVLAWLADGEVVKARQFAENGVPND